MYRVRRRSASPPDPGPQVLVIEALVHAPPPQTPVRLPGEGLPRPRPTPVPDADLIVQGEQDQRQQRRQLPRIVSIIDIPAHPMTRRERVFPPHVQQQRQLKRALSFLKSYYPVEQKKRTETPSESPFEFKRPLPPPRRHRRRRTSPIRDTADTPPATVLALEQQPADDPTKPPPKRPTRPRIATAVAVQLEPISLSPP